MDSLVVYRWPKYQVCLEQLRKVQFSISNGKFNKTRVFRRKAVEFEDSFLLNLWMVTKLAKELIKSSDSLKTTAIA